MDQSGTGRQVQGSLFCVCKFMDQSGTGRQVQRSLFWGYKFMDRGTGWQVKGPQVYFTLIIKTFYDKRDMEKKERKRELTQTETKLQNSDPNPTNPWT